MYYSVDFSYFSVGLSIVVIWLVFIKLLVIKKTNKILKKK